MSRHHVTPVTSERHVGPASVRSGSRSLETGPSHVQTPHYGTSRVRVVTHDTCSESLAAPAQLPATDALFATGTIRLIRIANADAAVAGARLVSGHTDDRVSKNGPGRRRRSCEEQPQRQNEGPMTIPGESRHESPSAKYLRLLHREPRRVMCKTPRPFARATSWIRGDPVARKRLGGSRSNRLFPRHSGGQAYSSIVRRRMLLSTGATPSRGAPDSFHTASRSVWRRGLRIPGVSILRQ